MRTSGSSTDIAKLLPTLASHGGTAFRPFDPVVALGTLFELGPPDKLQEVLIVLAESVVDLVFGTGHPFMVYTSAFQAVVLFATRTVIVV